MSVNLLPSDYEAFLYQLKGRIQQAQIHAVLSVNRELIHLYWQVGRDIWEKQKQQAWGAKIIGQLAQDLRQAFPQLKGFSARNLQYMRTFAEAYPDERQFAQQPVAQIPWGHNCVILDKLKDTPERLWYIQQTIHFGWSRNVLVHQIELGLYQRQGQALTNFAHTLPSPQSELAQTTLKDPYIFDFLTLSPAAHERDLQNALLDYLRKFLLELGVGFAFVGSEYHLEVDNQDYYFDLLFYHLRLRCYIIIDLKIGAFQPEFVGKMNFYLNAVNDLLRHPDDQPSIGIILCKTRGKLTAEYALRDIQSPMGVATYQFTASLPDRLKGNLPEIKDLEATLAESPEPTTKDAT